MTAIGKLPPIHDLAELPRPERGGPRAAAGAFREVLEQAIHTVDGLQQTSESAQAAFARGEDVELHDLMIRVEEAEIAFRTMMEVRNKLVEAYREVMRMGSGG